MGEERKDSWIQRHSPVAASKVCWRAVPFRLVFKGDDLTGIVLLGLASCVLLGEENLTLAGESPSPGRMGELLDAEAPAAIGSKVSLCCWGLRPRFLELIWKSAVVNRFGGRRQVTISEKKKGW